MISFGMTEEQELVRETMREFARDELRPHGRECDENSSIPDELLQSVWDLGLTSTQIPSAYGGGDEPRSMVTNAILLEELAHGDPALALAVVAPSQFANAILDQGTEAQEREKAAAFATKEGRYLYRLEEALRRLYNDPKNFGTCHTCGEEVGFERLEALPHARYCIDCKRKEESAA